MPAASYLRKMRSLIKKALDVFFIAHHSHYPTNLPEKLPICKRKAARKKMSVRLGLAARSALIFFLAACSCLLRKGLDDVVDIAQHNFRQVVPRLLQPVVGHAVL